ncbi:MAG: hypothetical protein Q8N43_01480 [Candidatus Azambacteria bacterium]|nr:hypothetical protein [Candidatus Azambacteria bacterium]
MKKVLILVLAFVFTLIVTASQANESQDGWAWTDGDQWQKQSVWINDGALAVWQKENQTIAGAANWRGSAEILANQVELISYQKELGLPNLSGNLEGYQSLEVTSEGKIKNGGNFWAENEAAQRTKFSTSLSDTGLTTEAKDTQKTRGQGWTDPTKLSMSVNMLQSHEYSLLADQGDWKSEHYGQRVQETNINASVKAGGFWFDVKQTNNGSTNTFVDGNKMVGAMNQSSSTEASGYRADIKASQTRYDGYNQTLTNPGFTGTQSGEIFSSTSVTIKK